MSDENYTTYKALTTIVMSDGREAVYGQLIQLTDEEAKEKHAANAIGLYIGDGEVADDTLPKPKKKRGRPASPKPLADEDLVTPDPKAR